LSALLEAERLNVRIPLSFGTLHPVRDVSFSVHRGEMLCIVGESGCGKSLTSLALMDLLPKRSRREAAKLVFDGVDLLRLTERQMTDLRGNRMAMIFQEPMTSLNPAYTIGEQLTEVLRRHRRVGRAAARDRAVLLLDKVGITAAAERLAQYPHQLSGGLRQRVMIAMALMCGPKLLIADEPTTALDVTIQAQILEIILELQHKLGTAVILITHDLGVVAETAQLVIVMYAGRKVEEAPVEELFARPLHPYTHGLLASIPRLGLMRGETAGTDGRLQEIPGIVPALSNLPEGCAFAPRCAFAEERCRQAYPPYEEKRPGHWAACWRSDALYGAGNA
jgi:peptide/nickel transport system ATP-binding protein